MPKKKDKVAILTSGGLAPCLNASLAYLIHFYTEFSPKTEILAYLFGYAGLLKDEKIKINSKIRKNYKLLTTFGGSVLGNSRMYIAGNDEDAYNKGYIRKNETSLEVASRQIIKEGITILHTIGGEGTTNDAMFLWKYLNDVKNYPLSVICLPKTIDNDIFPVTQTLGAMTAVHQGVVFFENVVNEYSSTEKHLIVHEIMGRNCGWLTARTAFEYRTKLDEKEFLEDVGLSRDKFDIDAIYIEEMKIDWRKEALRLKEKMSEKGSLNVFLSESFGSKNIIKEMKERGEKVPTDPFGSVHLAKVESGKRIGEKLKSKVGARKLLVQKSGYFARSSPPDDDDLSLIEKTALKSVKSALKGKSGLVGLDSEMGDYLHLIEFHRIEGGRRFDLETKWFRKMMREIGQEVIE